MNKLYFSHQEFILRKDLPVASDIIDKIIEYHLLPMNDIRQKFGSPIIVSKSSGYRHMEHEIEKNRLPTSSHLFMEHPERQDPGYGASDYTVAPALFVKFIELMVESQYTRIAFYPFQKTPFIHCDYRFFGVDKFYYFVNHKNEWHRVTKFELIDAVGKRFQSSAT